MSWDAHLTDDRGHEEGWWNYTHNTSVMIYDIIGSDGLNWWKQLDGLSGPEGAAFLNRIIKGLEADPEKYRKMNPENGWGNYDGLLKTLIEMRDSVPEWPTVWSASG